MKIYKLKHKPTELFYGPNSGSGNLTPKGKIYDKPPKIENNIFNVRVIIQFLNAKRELSDKNKSLINHFKLSKTLRPWGKYEWDVDKRFNVPMEDWEIVKF